MIALLQRVQQANVVVNGQIISAIDAGLLAFIGVERADTEAQAERLLQRLLGYRIFSDEQDRMNLSVRDINGGLLLVPQFTLAADTQKGMRPSFTPAAPPAQGEALFQYLLDLAQRQYDPDRIASGRFGADMKISLINDGPVTFWLKI